MEFPCSVTCGGSILAALLGAASPADLPPPSGAASLVGPRLKSDDGAVVFCLTATGPVVERDERDGLTEVFGSAVAALPLYNVAMSSDGSVAVFCDRWCRLRSLRKADGQHKKFWLLKDVALPILLNSYTRLAITDDEEAERVMSLRLVRDYHTRDKYGSNEQGPVLLVVEREERRPWNATCAAVSYQVVGVDLMTGESVELQDCCAQRLPRGRRGNRPILPSLISPDEVVNRLSRIMPLEDGRKRVGRSLCLDEPPGQLVR